MWRRAVALLLALAVLGSNAADGSRPRISTSLGPLEGIWMTSELGYRYAAYLGVPFAQPPLGKLRFQLAKPAEPWKGTWDAGIIAPQCLTFDHRMHPMDNQAIKGHEDCLYLNIYTPENSEKMKKPLAVIVFIHAGGFMFGTSNQYGAKYLADRNIVLVTINYRIGPFGFLSFEDDVLPGNNGLKDQVEALRWVKKHIASFGGDPENVSIMGLSAGGSSVHYHYLSPLSKDLFKRGVSMSGTALCRWALTENAKEKSLKIAAGVGCTQTKSEEILDCLRERPAQNIVAQVEHLQVWQYTPFSPLGPVVEKKSKDAFLTDTPANLLKSGKFAKLPWVTGVTASEGLYPAATFVSKDHELSRLDAEFDDLVPFLLDFNYTVSAAEKQKVLDLIRTEYFNGEKIDSKSVPQIIKMISDRLFKLDAQIAAEVHATRTPNVWFYHFTHRGKHSLSDLMSGTSNDYGASHADDVSYFLNVTFIPQDVPRTGLDADLQKQMTDLWSTFAEVGIPLAPGVLWNPVKPESPLQYLLINSSYPSKMETVDDLGNAKFWQSLPFQESVQIISKNSARDEL
ncbi:venom carboxylesterase-6-like [Cloeon dipterum]|uniref:venom carboxylesterase-6-like n=1 Tax=Cloeon dipterum TaxID=197152 RepID=UPI00322078A7